MNNQNKTRLVEREEGDTYKVARLKKNFSIQFAKSNNSTTIHPNESFEHIIIFETRLVSNNKKKCDDTQQSDF